MEKRIIIMGATSGLGRACAEDFISCICLLHYANYIS